MTKFFDTFSLSELKTKIEVPKDKDAFYSNDSLTNRDIIPIPSDRRTWTPFSYATYWIVEGVSISGYTTGSTLVGFGLSPKQSICCSVAARHHIWCNGCHHGMDWVSSSHWFPFDC
ncbi:unnamed protein product [Ambrosiozyma monospora]|uniref:Unnamed protein product n=1 Tax=Ambrosiozyma monospora TaxID=43982 RepID=A0ACB5T8P4_AMBMO|nr:unnamed protein product [Ambrosiozyma monospora]